MTEVACWDCGAELAQEKFIENEPNYCPQCASPVDHGKVLDREGFGSSPPKQGHRYAPNFSTDTAPSQGWKIHISGSPFETYVMTEQLLPKLMEEGINHKVVESRSKLQKWIDSKSKNRYKSIVIYPDIDKNKRWAMKDFPDVGNAQVFVKSPKERKITLNGKTRKEEGINIVNINSNTGSSENVVELVEQLLADSSISLGLTEKAPDIHPSQSDEKNVVLKGAKTRMSYRYDVIYSNNGVQVTNSAVLESSRAQLENDKNQGQSHWMSLDDKTKKVVLGAKGNKIKDYREAKDVLNYDGFTHPFN